jgi:hypothetical protein
MNALREYADKLADKLMDAGNITFAALIVGQILGGRPFRWDIAALGGLAWLGFYIASYFAVRLKTR